MKLDDEEEEQRRLLREHQNIDDLEYVFLILLCGLGLAMIALIGWAFIVEEIIQ